MLSRLKLDASTVDHVKNLRIPNEEAEVVRGDGEDVELLVSVDALIGDDALLETIGTTITQARLDPDKVLQLALELIKCRASPSARDPAEGVPTPLDLRSLSKRSYTAITAMIGSALATHPSGTLVPAATQPSWVVNSIIILFSPSSHALPDAVLRTLLDLLSDDEGCTCEASTVIAKCISDAMPLSNPVDFVPLAPRLLQVMKWDGGRVCSQFHLQIYGLILAQRWSIPFHDYFDDFLKNNVERCQTADIEPVINDVWQLLIEAMRFEYLERKMPSSSAFSHGSPFAIQSIFHLAYISGSPSRVEQAAELYAQLITTHRTSVSIMDITAVVHPRARISDDFMPVILEKAFTLERIAGTFRLVSQT